jgi:hypothetical protein
MQSVSDLSYERQTMLEIRAGFVMQGTRDAASPSDAEADCPGRALP